MHTILFCETEQKKGENVKRAERDAVNVKIGEKSGVQPDRGRKV